MHDHAAEVRRGKRFEFGRNWTRFLTLLDEHRIALAVSDLQSMLGVGDLCGQSFLDIGSGSGLSSLAARRLGAKVYSFDYDPASVACTRALKDRYFPDDSRWTIAEGSALDAEYLRSLGRFDIVYSWGVLHHTGAMWQALDNAMIPLADDGRLFIAIYNHQLTWTKVYKLVKRSYVSAPAVGKWLILASYVAVTSGINLAKDLVMLRNPLARYLNNSHSRGMSTRHDLIDWVGGYPFETARPDEIFDFYRLRGMLLRRLKTLGGPACNQFVFERVPPREPVGAELIECSTA